MLYDSSVLPGGIGEAQGLLCAIVSLDQNVWFKAVGSLGSPRRLVMGEADETERESEREGGKKAN
ncbi:uncharacterized protein PgNI_08619 [Pyricularia grisea]|uniref:Uncharacterized protein n=1 Tax=Pyricularia grisea TaxID=148305 RepID=A0A6P8AWL1_PYRGI|nr:uncharacterized protein PgNI_08619 [Pyricularia grisea]TLD06621.1 hypothetical protein PgNI_08619 [Pyricularia grisea]